MKNEVRGTSRSKKILLTIVAIFVTVFVIVPITFSLFEKNKFGNVALIPINGVLTTDGGSYLGSSTTSSKTIVDFLQKAKDDEQIKVILLEINCQGGSPVATDEIVSAIQKVKAEKPVVAVIREVGASGGYWVASAANYVIANRMSMTGSIGVFSSYLEFSGLMNQYGVGYERINSGKYKDLGIPYRKLDDNEKKLLQDKADKLHQFFIQGVAENRGLDEEKVRSLATGEVFLGIEALNYGLIDKLGNKDTAQEYIKEKYALKEIEYVVYEREASLMDILSGNFGSFGVSIGKGLGSVLFMEDQELMFT